MPARAASARADESLVGNLGGAVADRAAVGGAHVLLLTRLAAPGRGGVSSASTTRGAVLLRPAPAFGGAVVGEASVAAFVVGEAAEHFGFDRAAAAGVAPAGAVVGGEWVGHRLGSVCLDGVRARLLVCR